MNEMKDPVSARRKGKKARSYGTGAMRIEHDGFVSALSRLAAAKRSFVSRGIASALFFFTLTAFSLLLSLERLIPHWHYMPLFVFIAFWGSAAAALAIGAIFLSSSASLWEVSREVGRELGVGSLISSALDFSRGRDRLASFSPFLVDETITRSRESIERVDVKRLYGPLGRPDFLLGAILIGLVVIVQVLAFPGEVDRFFAAVSDPRASFRRHPSVNLVVASPDRTVLSGEDVTLEAVAFGSLKHGVELNLSYVEGVWKKVPVETDTISFDNVPLTAYRRTIEKVNEGFTYYFSAGDERSMTRRVSVMRRPVINRLSLIQRFPSYTDARPETVATLAGKVMSMVGSQIVIEGEASKEVVSGGIFFASGRVVPIEPRGYIFTASFDVNSTDTFFVGIVDRDGLKNERAVHYPIVASKDRCPEAEIVLPNDNSILPRTQEVTIHYRAYDDFGISSIKLRYTREGKWSDFRTVEIPVGSRMVQKQASEIEDDYRWSLKGVNLFPGDRVAYYLEVSDNNTLRGPCTRRSKTRRLIVPSLSRMYAEARKDETIQRSDMEEILEKGREIRKSLVELSEGLKSQRKLDYNMKKQAEEVLNKQNELREKLDEAINRLEKTLDEYDKNRLTSRQIGEKMEKLQELLKQMRSTKLADAIEKLQAMLKRVPQKDVLSAMKDIELDTDKLLQGLDRTIELFKQIMRQERMEEYMRRMEDMLDRQIALRDSTAAGDTSGVSVKERKLAEEADSLKSDVGTFSKQEEDSLIAEKLRDLSAKMNESTISDRMSQAADRLDSGDLSGAKQYQNGAVSEMLSLYSAMGQCQMAMGLALSDELIAKIERAISELLDVSKEEEQLAFEMRSSGGNVERNDLLFRQLVLKNAIIKITNDLSDVARKSFAIPTGTFAMLGRAISSANSTLMALDAEDVGQASGLAANTTRDLNVVVISLLESASSSGGSGTGAREKMQQMMQQQLSISQEIQRLMQQKGSQGLSMEEMAEMARLAAKQRKMAELLKQIEQESRSAEELLGQVDDIAEMMKDAAEKMRRGELDAELVEREQRILSRMLESQKALRTRDYDRKRVSRTAGNVKALLPEGNVPMGSSEDVILEAIRRSMKQDGPEEYRELIRRYFRSLSKKVRERVE